MWNSNVFRKVYIGIGTSTAFLVSIKTSINMLDVDPDYSGSNSNLNAGPVLFGFLNGTVNGLLWPISIPTNLYLYFKK